MYTIIITNIYWLMAQVCFDKFQVKVHGRTQMEHKCTKHMILACH